MADAPGKCRPCEHLAWRAESGSDKAGLYCRATAENLEPGGKYDDCKRFSESAAARRARNAAWLKQARQSRRA